jgi:hypothetical protein
MLDTMWYNDNRREFPLDLCDLKPTSTASSWPSSHPQVGGNEFPEENRWMFQFGW